MHCKWLWYWLRGRVPPALLKEKLKDTLDHIRVYILRKKRKFCFTIDLKQVLKELTPQELQENDSMEYVSWHNTAFWLTNHCKPYHSFMYVNTVLFWTTLFPYALFVALPYRAGRRLLCKDKLVAVRTPMKLTYGNVDDKVVVFLWKNDLPPPGEYNRNSNRFSITAAHLNWLHFCGSLAWSHLTCRWWRRLKAKISTLRN